MHPTLQNLKLLQLENGLSYRAEISNVSREVYGNAWSNFQPNVFSRENFMRLWNVLEKSWSHASRYSFFFLLFQRSVELCPTDATTLYLLGNWCYQVADLAWYQRKIVAVIFGEPPSATFEEALEFFERAERTEPNFYSHNFLMLGKTCLKLNKKEDAVKYLKMAADFPARNDDDLEAKKEATKLLASM